MLLCVVLLRFLLSFLIIVAVVNNKINKLSHDQCQLKLDNGKIANYSNNNNPRNLFKNSHYKQTNKQRNTCQMESGKSTHTHTWEYKLSLNVNLFTYGRHTHLGIHTYIHSNIYICVCIANKWRHMMCSLSLIMATNCQR